MSDGQMKSLYTNLVSTYEDIDGHLPIYTVDMSSTFNKKYVSLRNILVDNGCFNEIPKRVFYVWGANEPKKQSVIDCMKTWYKFLPEYMIIVKTIAINKNIIQKKVNIFLISFTLTTCRHYIIFYIKIKDWFMHQPCGNLILIYQLM